MIYYVSSGTLNPTHSHCAGEIISLWEQRLRFVPLMVNIQTDRHANRQHWSDYMNSSASWAKKLGVYSGNSSAELIKCWRIWQAEGRIHNVTMLTSTPREGATLQFICTFRYVFPQIQVRLRRFVWYLNNVKLSPVKRLKINVTEPDLTGTWVSTLAFNPATPEDSGSDDMLLCLY